MEVHKAKCTVCKNEIEVDDPDPAIQWVCSECTEKLEEEGRKKACESFGRLIDEFLADLDKEFGSYFKE